MATCSGQRLPVRFTVGELITVDKPMSAASRMWYHASDPFDAAVRCLRVLSRWAEFDSLCLQPRQGSTRQFHLTAMGNGGKKSTAMLRSHAQLSTRAGVTVLYRTSTGQPQLRTSAQLHEGICICAAFGCIAPKTTAMLHRFVSRRFLLSWLDCSFAMSGRKASCSSVSLGTGLLLLASSNEVVSAGRSLQKSDQSDTA